jgi:hypothetical protein
MAESSGAIVKDGKLSEPSLGSATTAVWLFDMNAEFLYIKHFFILHAFLLLYNNFETRSS